MDCTKVASEPSVSVNGRVPAPIAFFTAKRRHMLRGHIRRSRIAAIVRCGHAHCPVSAGETALGSLCSPSRRVNDTE